MIVVILATYNGALTLNQTLAAFCELVPPSGGYRLVVVDNGSNDETPQILESFVGKLPMEILQQPTPGKNHALNLAIEYLSDSCDSADLYIFTDDDVLPQPDWLQRYEAGAASHPGYSLFGGQVIPHWNREPPEWLRYLEDEFWMLYGESKEASGPCAPACIYGANMAVRPSVFAKGFRYHEGLGLEGQRAETSGPIKTDWLTWLLGGGGGGEPMGSETEFLMRTGEAGERAWYLSEAVVGHIIRPFQMEWSWVLKRSYRAGRGEGLMASRSGERLLFGVPYWLFKDAFSTMSKLVFSGMKDSAERRRLSYRLQWIRGAICGARSRHLGR